MDLHGLPEITDLVPGGLADATGKLRVGDVVEEVSGTRTADGPDVLMSVLSSAHGRITLVVRSRKEGDAPLSPSAAVVPADAADAGADASAIVSAVVETGLASAAAADAAAAAPPASAQPQPAAPVKPRATKPAAAAPSSTAAAAAASANAAPPVAPVPAAAAAPSAAAREAERQSAASSAMTALAATASPKKGSPRRLTRTFEEHERYAAVQLQRWMRGRLARKKHAKMHRVEWIRYYCHVSHEFDKAMGLAATAHEVKYVTKWRQEWQRPAEEHMRDGFAANQKGDCVLARSAFVRAFEKSHSVEAQLSAVRAHASAAPLLSSLVPRARWRNATSLYLAVSQSLSRARGAPCPCPHPSPSTLSPPARAQANMALKLREPRLAEYEYQQILLRTDLTAALRQACIEKLSRAAVALAEVEHEAMYADRPWLERLFSDDPALLPDRVTLLGRSTSFDATHVSAPPEQSKHGLTALATPRRKSSLLLADSEASSMSPHELARWQADALLRSESEGGTGAASAYRMLMLLALLVALVLVIVVALGVLLPDAAAAEARCLAPPATSRPRRGWFSRSAAPSPPPARSLVDSLTCLLGMAIEG